jgi:hypothetical protein
MRTSLLVALSMLSCTDDVGPHAQVPPPGTWAGPMLTRTYTNTEPWYVYNDQEILGDIDGDGFDDVALVLRKGQYDYPSELQVYPGGPDGPPAQPLVTLEPADFALPTHTLVQLRAVGDVDADGHDDFAVTLSDFDAGTGVVFVVHGGPTGLVMPPTWSQAAIGVPVGVGDLDGDGYDDVAASRSDEVGQRVEVYYGGPNGLETTPGWASEVTDGESLGDIVMADCDVNGDGFADLGFSRWRADGGGFERGQAEVYLGIPAGPTPLPTWVINGTVDGDRLGLAMTCIGDPDADGFDDLALRHGRDVEVYEGFAGGLIASPVVTLSPPLGDSYQRIHRVGDMDGDGFDDLALSGQRGTAARGYTTVFLATPPPAYFGIGWDVQERASFYAVESGGGDVNGDGYGDILLGINAWNENIGWSWVYLGQGGDTDGDGVGDNLDTQPNNANRCYDSDRDTCDDCSGPGAGSRPQSDGTDTDGDGLCDAGDPDDDGDSILDGPDPDRIDPAVCGDRDNDGCDDCALELFPFPPHDGPDLDRDGLCDVGDPDADADGVFGAADPGPLNPNRCGDTDGDGCDDCSLLGLPDPSRDGPDADRDGVCDAGDPDPDGDGLGPGADNDDDGDTVNDGPDPAPNNSSICGVDADGDGCDDCTLFSRPLPEFDGPDFDSDGICDGSDTTDDHYFNGTTRAETIPSPTTGFNTTWGLGAAVLALGDVDGNGFVDVIVTAGDGDFSNTDRGEPFLYLADADGFRVAPDWSPAGRTNGARLGTVLAAGDFDGDGHPDLAAGAPGEWVTLADGTTAEDAGEIHLYAGVPGGLSDTPTVFAGVAARQGYGSAFQVGDLDGDGYDDLVVRASRGSGTPTRLRWHRGGPSGISPTEAEAFPDYRTFVLGDVTGDGVDDLVGADPFADFPTSGNDAGALSVHASTPTGPSLAPTWTRWGATSAAALGSALAIVPDLDGDGDDELAVGAEYADEVLLYLGDPAGLDAQVAQIWHGTGLGEHLASGADLDGDGRSEIVGLADGGYAVMHPFAPDTRVVYESSVNDVYLALALIPAGGQSDPGIMVGDPDYIGDAYVDVIPRPRDDPDLDHVCSDVDVDGDGDGLVDAIDGDDDGDTVPDGADPSPDDSRVCGDADSDTCDDCSRNGRPTVGDDGADFDGDGICDVGDSDDDNDFFADAIDVDPLDPLACTDSDGDGCDDCSNGRYDPAGDGVDTDGDGACDLGDVDDDDDGVVDVDDPAPFDASQCGDTDLDTCDDCTQGSFEPLFDGPDADGDGICDAGERVSLTMGGSCTGRVDIDLEDATPGGTVVLLYANSPGVAFAPQSTPCAGLSLGLDRPQLGTTVVADASGRFGVSVRLPPALCGAFVQAVDVGQCRTSSVVAVP